MFNTICCLWKDSQIIGYRLSISNRQPLQTVSDKQHQNELSSVSFCLKEKYLWKAVLRRFQSYSGVENLSTYVTGIENASFDVLLLNVLHNIHHSAVSFPFFLSFVFFLTGGGHFCPFPSQTSPSQPLDQTYDILGGSFLLCNFETLQYLRLCFFSTSLVFSENFSPLFRSDHINGDSRICDMLQCDPSCDLESNLSCDQIAIIELFNLCVCCHQSEAQSSMYFVQPPWLREDITTKLTFTFGHWPNPTFPV